MTITERQLLQAGGIYTFACGAGDSKSIGDLTNRARS